MTEQEAILTPPTDGKLYEENCKAIKEDDGLAQAADGKWYDENGKQFWRAGTVFSKDYETIDAEIERLKPLVELGGYIFCPDHRIAPDAKWENVQYYCEKMRDAFDNI